MGTLRTIAFAGMSSLLLLGCAKSEDFEGSGGGNFQKIGTGGSEEEGGSSAGGSSSYNWNTGGAAGLAGQSGFPGGSSSGGGATSACVSGEQHSCYPSDASEIGVGICKAGTETCVNGAWSACVGAVLPQAEVCDGSLDENCDGEVDEGCCTTQTYQKDTGLVSGYKTICCDSGDTLKNAEDCGVGDNHTKSVDGNCATGSEGAGNNGSACVKITCEKKICN